MDGQEGAFVSESGDVSQDGQHSGGGSTGWTSGRSAGTCARGGGRRRHREQPAEGGGGGGPGLRDSHSWEKGINSSLLP